MRIIEISDNDLQFSQTLKTQRYITSHVDFRDDLTINTNTDTACNLLQNKRINKKKCLVNHETKPPTKINLEESTILMTESLRSVSGSMGESPSASPKKLKKNFSEAPFDQFALNTTQKIVEDCLSPDEHLRPFQHTVVNDFKEINRNTDPIERKQIVKVSMLEGMIDAQTPSPTASDKFLNIKKSAKRQLLSGCESINY